MEKIFPRIALSLFVILLLGVQPSSSASQNETNKILDSDVMLMFPSNESVCFNQSRYVHKVKYDEVRECKEIFTKKCFKDFRTDYHRSKVRVCRESFKENCDIKYHYEIHPRKIKICEEVEDPCDPEKFCTEIVETECKTIIIDAMTHKDEVECKPIHKKICSQPNCKVGPKKQVCRNSTQSLIQEIPREKCKLVPLTDCKNETKLLPKIKEDTICQQVPSDVCVNLKKNPVRVKELEVKTICSSGPWSSYDDWSECSAACGVGITTRKRTCNGKCIGKAIQTGICMTNKKCPDSSTSELRPDPELSTSGLQTTDNRPSTANDSGVQTPSDSESVPTTSALYSNGSLAEMLSQAMKNSSMNPEMAQGVLSLMQLLLNSTELNPRPNATEPPFTTSVFGVAGLQSTSDLTTSGNQNGSTSGCTNVTSNSPKLSSTSSSMPEDEGQTIIDAEITPSVLDLMELDIDTDMMIDVSIGSLSNNVNGSDSNVSSVNSTSMASSMTPDSDSELTEFPTLEAIENEEYIDECMIRGVRFQRARGSWQRIMNRMSLRDCKNICGKLKDCRFFTYIETPKSGKCILMSIAASFETNIKEASVSISGTADCVIPS